MRIISKFKDYYDHISHIYGIDDRVIYTRTPFPDGTKLDTEGIRRIATYGSNVGVSHRWISVCAKYYLIREDHLKQKRELITEQHPDYPKYVERRFGLSKNWLNHDESPELMRMSKDLNAPVFAIGPFGLVLEIPKLGELGFSKIIPPEQMYQGIEYFLSSKIKDSPDITPAPKPPMTDKERILSHGFDAKVSFRHRK